MGDGEFGRYGSAVSTEPFTFKKPEEGVMTPEEEASIRDIVENDYELSSGSGKKLLAALDAERAKSKALFTREEVICAVNMGGDAGGPYMDPEEVIAELLAERAEEEKKP